MLPRINVDEPWLIERAYQILVSGAPRQPMFLLDRGYLLQPGYSLLLAPWLKMFGVGLLQARLLAVLFGLATLWCVYACGVLLFGVEVGVVSALLLATDSNFLGISRFARTDGPAVLFAALALLLFLRARASGRRLPLAGSGFAAGVAMLCHANCYWVVVVLGVWHLLVYGRRFIVPGIVSSLGFALSFGPYLALILTRREEFNAQLNMFAIERVPSLQLPTILLHVSHETERYRDWYFGLITDFSFNPMLRIFQLCAAAGMVWLAASVIAGLRSRERRPSEELLFSAATIAAFIFAAFIPNKALVYLPHLLFGYSLAGGYFVWRLSRVAAPLVSSARVGVSVLTTMSVAGMSAIAVPMYDVWYYRMVRSDLTPYAVTGEAIRMLVPPGPKYLIASPTFWLPFHDDRETKFVAYTAAGPFRTAEPRGFFTRRRIYDLPQDRPFYLLVDEVEWKRALDDPAYAREWRDAWTSYIRDSCAFHGAALATAHGNLALYRCWNDGTPQPLEPEYVQDGHRYRRAAIAWTATPEEMAGWRVYRPATHVARGADVLRVAGSGAGIFGDAHVQPNVPYLMEVNVDGARTGDLVSVHSVSANGTVRGSQWTPLKQPAWFPSGTIVMPVEPTLRIYLYSESATDFGVRSVTLYSLVDDTVPAAR